jgi:hypothetical protein
MLSFPLETEFSLGLASLIESILDMIR